MVERGPTHVTDTLAIRKLVGTLSGNWVERAQQDRDYGIDLQVERFDESKPTGDILLFQVKGTTKRFANKKTITINFPVSTLKYILLFDIPFFICRVSIPDGLCRFVWAQKYIATKLKKEFPKWKSQDTVTISFPIKNTLTTDPEAIINILLRYKRRRSGLQFLIHFEWLESSWDDYKDGQVALLKGCLKNYLEVRKLKSFLEYYDPGIDKSKLDEIREIFENGKLSSFISEKDIEIIDDHILDLAAVKASYLGEDELDMFTYMHSDTPPY